MARFCPTCGASLEDGVTFCGSCGTKIEQFEPQQQYAPQPGPQPQYQYAPQPEPQPQYQYAPQPEPQPQYQYAPQNNAQQSAPKGKSKISKKANASIVMWTSLLLAALMLFLAFMPVITIDTKKANVMGEFISEFDVEVPDELEVSFADVVGSFEFIGKILEVAFLEDKMSSDDYEFNEEDFEKYEAAAEALDEMTEREGSDKMIYIAAVIAAELEGVADFDLTSSSNVAYIVYTIVASVISLWLAFIFILVFILMAAVAFMKILIRTLANIKKPHLGATKVAHEIPKMIQVPLAFMILTSLIPSVSLAWGVTAIFGVVGAFAVMCVILTRLHSYQPQKLAYLNIVQGVSFVSIVGFFVFFVNIIKSKVFTNFMSGYFGNYVTGVAFAEALESELGVAIEIDNGYIFDAILILLFVLTVMASTKHLSFLVNRLACTINPKKRMEEANVDSGLVTSIFMLIAFIAPTIMKGNKYDIDGSEISFLVLNSEESSALTMALVGIIIMIVAEIALKILKKKFCKNLSPYETNSVVCHMEQTKDYIR